MNKERHSKNFEYDLDEKKKGNSEKYHDLIQEAIGDIWIKKSIPVIGDVEINEKTYFKRNHSYFFNGSDMIQINYYESWMENNFRVEGEISSNSENRINELEKSLKDIFTK